MNNGLVLIAAAVFASAVTALFAGCSSSPSTTNTSPPPIEDASTADASPAMTDASAADEASIADASADGRGSNAHAPPSQGGTSGTVDSVSTPSFTVTTGAGQMVTVNETSTTTYSNAAGPGSANDITAGENVLVLGVVNSTILTATQVTVLPSTINEPAASADAGVLPFQPGAPSASKTVGQIPSYTEGQGTIVSGTVADQATESALGAYPGVIVDRVVLLSGGDYEVHCVSVNWPHHVFVDAGFNVVGAN